MKYGITHVMYCVSTGLGGTRGRGARGAGRDASPRHLALLTIQIVFVYFVRNVSFLEMYNEGGNNNVIRKWYLVPSDVSISDCPETSFIIRSVAFFGIPCHSRVCAHK